MEVLFGILIPFLGTTLGSACVFFMKRSLGDLVQRALAGFAAGVMVAASIWSLLIPAIAQSDHMGRLSFLPALAGFWAGVLFLLLLDRLIPHLHVGSDQAEGPKSKLGRTTMMVLAVTLHNIPEGMAVGLSFALAVQSGSPALMAGAVSLALGIGVQNLPEGAAVALPLLDAGLPKRTAFAVGALSALVEPVFGVLAALAVTVAQPLMPWLLGFAAGAMLLVTVRELIPEACGGAERAGTLSVLAGFLLMMILDVALG